MTSGAFDIKNGQITALRPNAHPSDSRNLDFLITDLVDAHVFPHAAVQENVLNAPMARDAVVVAGGTTTVFVSLYGGTSLKRREGRDLLLPLGFALDRDRAKKLFRVDHLLHMRGPISNPTRLP